MPFAVKAGFLLKSDNFCEKSFPKELRVPLILIIINNQKMSDHNELIAQFVDMTGAPESQAQFYLEMGEWNLEVRQQKHTT